MQEMLAARYAARCGCQGAQSAVAQRMQHTLQHGQTPPGLAATVLPGPYLRTTSGILEQMQGGEGQQRLFVYSSP